MDISLKAKGARMQMGYQTVAPSDFTGVTPDPDFYKCTWEQNQTQNIQFTYLKHMVLKIFKLLLLVSQQSS